MESQEVVQGTSNEQIPVKPQVRRAKPASRRAKRVDRPVQRTRPEVLDEPERKIPRKSVWICREQVMWTHAQIPGGSHLFSPDERDTNQDSPTYGEILTWTVTFQDWEEPHLFDYANGFWFPAGRKIVDVMNERVFPRQFEPLDFSCLVDPRLVYFARNNIAVKNKFTFKSAADIKIPSLEDIEIPEPLVPGKQVKTMIDPGAVPRPGGTSRMGF